MKILLVGATGTIGSAVSSALTASGHEVLAVGRSSGPLNADLGDPASIRALFDVVGSVDHVVCTAGVARFGALAEVDDDGWRQSLENKLMGQVNLVRYGLGHVPEGGSFTLTTGTLSTAPTPGSVAVATTGGAVESFGRAAALDLATHRINVISPGWVAESRQAIGLEPMPGIWADALAAYYVRCVEGDMTGQVFEAVGPLED